MKVRNSPSVCWVEFGVPLLLYVDRSRRSLLLNPFAWVGLAAIALLVLAAYVVVNDVLMPLYTRQGASVEVPDVRQASFDDAQERLERLGLRVTRETRRFDPSRPRGSVTDQSPLGGALVKPGRIVLLTVNEGRQPRLRMPSLVGASIREARSRAGGLGLRIAEEVADTIPSPYRNTVTQQTPAAGDSVTAGTSITLWYSTGPSDRYEVVPDVVGKTVAEARAELLKNRLRALVVDAEGSTDRLIVRRQSREAGTSVRGGYEVRLFTRNDSTSAPPPETPPR